MGFDLTGTLTRAYFDVAYNLVYDFITAPLAMYQGLQKRCIDGLDLKDGDSVLCVGLGTGNEITRIAAINPHVHVTGIDFSVSALRNAHRKARKIGKEVSLMLMDARHLDFPPESFSKVLCLHVMDFVVDKAMVTREILRVLKEDGQFVVTYPSQAEGSILARNILQDIFSRKNTNRKFIQILALPIRFLAGFVYLPLMLRPQRKHYSKLELESLLGKYTHGLLHIEEYPLYQDFIVQGKKSTKRSEK